MRRVFFSFTIFLVLCSVSCQKKPVKNVPKIDPEIEKLAKVLSSMSQRCKDEIPNGSPFEFLSDLRVVLQADRDDLLLLCDKTHPLPDNFEPLDLAELFPNDSYNVNRRGLFLRAPAVRALKKMGDAARKDGLTILVSSTYRSFSRQKEVYDALVKQDGQAEADRESARAGTSQHQTGAAVDFGSIDSSYEETKVGKWLLEHAFEYGWSLSFPKDYEDVTGYRYECWHFRYIGVEACKFQKKWFGDVQQFMLEFIDAWKKA